MKLSLDLRALRSQSHFESKMSVKQSQAQASLRHLMIVAISLIGRSLTLAARYSTSAQAVVFISV
jgi:hypothetical protein